MPQVLTTPKAEAAVPPAQVAESLNSREDMEAYIRRAYPARAAEIISVVSCESDFNKDAQGDFRNGEYTSFGLVQIHRPAHPELSLETIKDPRWSLDYIIKEFKAGHEKQWSCYK